MGLTLKLEAGVGDDIQDVVKEGVRIARQLNLCVQIESNGVTLLLYWDTDVSRVCDQWRSAMRGELKARVLS